MRPTINHFKHAFYNDGTVIALLVSVMCVVFGIRFNVAIVSVVGAVVQFASFDAIVFRYVHRQNESDMQGRAYYRIVQAVYQYGLALILAHSFGWWALLYIALWWVGVCDWLYYVLLKEKGIGNVPDMYWVDWTAQGIVCSLVLNRNLTGREFHTWMWVLIAITTGATICLIR
jgi:hypothetical protein